MKKAMLFFAAFLFSVSVHAASLDLTSVSGKGVVPAESASGSALYATSTPYRAGEIIKDVWSLNVTESGYWAFTITANSNNGSLPAPFTATLNDTIYSVLGSSIIFSLFLEEGVYALLVDGLSNHTWTGYDLAINAVPVPAALLLFAPALLGLIGLRRKAMAKAA